MKGLATLIKLNKRALDELRRKMASLQNQKEQLLGVSAKLRQDLEMEMALAGRQPEMAHFFGDFSKRIQRRQDDIAGEIHSLDQQMERLSGQIAEAFAEVKKFEIAQENAQKRAEENARRKETLLLDEIAAQQHRRAQDE